MKICCAAGASGFDTFTVASSTGIEHLPPEVLAIVFTYLYLDAKKVTELLEESLQRSGADWDDQDDETTRDDAAARVRLNQERSSLLIAARLSTFFPYSCASVCPMWRNVLSTRPAFWTRIVLFIDSQPTTLDAASDCLAWSRNLPVDVIMTRRPDLNAEQTEENQEKTLVEAFMDLLQPHIARLRSLRIDVGLSEALPSLTHEMWEDASQLVDLSLQCERDGPGVDEVDVEEDDGEDEDGCYHQIVFPVTLKVAHIDGRNFRRSCLNSQDWLGWQYGLEQITINNFRPKRDDNAYTLSTRQTLAKLEDLSALVSLKLENIQFLIEPQEPWSQTIILERLQCLYLDKIRAEAVVDLFRICQFPALIMLHMHICVSLDKALFASMDPHVPILFLSIIFPNVDLVDFLTPWQGLILYLMLYNPSRADPDLLPELAKQRDVDENNAVPGGRNFICPDMHSLFYMHSTLHSIESLKKLVEQRNHYVDYNDPDWRTNTTWGPAMKTVMVSHAYPTATISKEDIAWFDERLVEFRWE